MICIGFRLPARSCFGEGRARRRGFPRLHCRTKETANSGGQASHDYAINSLKSIGFKQECDLGK